MKDFNVPRVSECDIISFGCTYIHDKVDGGELEIIRMEKHAGMEALVELHQSFSHKSPIVVPFSKKN